MRPCFSYFIFDKILIYISLFKKDVSILSRYTCIQMSLVCRYMQVLMKLKHIFQGEVYKKYLI